MNWRRLRKWTMIVSLIGGLAVAVAVWWVGGALVAPANRIVGSPPLDFAAESVEIPSASGSILAGWYLPIADSKATVVLLHPIRSDRRSMLSRARIFRDRGYSTLLVDLQAHGESPGDAITVGYVERHDVRAVVDFVRNQTPDHRIAIVGRSLGGAATILANPEIDALVIESVYPTVAEAVHNRVEMRVGPLHHLVAPLLLIQLKPRLGISPQKLRPVEQLSSIQCPVLVAAGDVDQHTPLEESQRMFDAANEPKSFVVFQGAGHEDLLAYDPEKYESEIVAFVEDALRSRFGDTLPQK